MMIRWLTTQCSFNAKQNIPKHNKQQLIIIKPLLFQIIHGINSYEQIFADLEICKLHYMYTTEPTKSFVVQSLLQGINPRRIPKTLKIMQNVINIHMTLSIDRQVIANLGYVLDLYLQKYKYWLKLRQLLLLHLDYMFPLLLLDIFTRSLNILSLLTCNQLNPSYCYKYSLNVQH